MLQHIKLWPLNKLCKPSKRSKCFNSSERLTVSKFNQSQHSSGASRMPRFLRLLIFVVNTLVLRLGMFNSHKLLVNLVNMALLAVRLFVFVLPGVLSVETPTESHYTWDTFPDCVPCRFAASANPLCVALTQCFKAFSLSFSVFIPEVYIDVLQTSFPCLFQRCP